MVHGILLANVPREEADDLVQDVFLIAMRRISDLRDPNSFGPWLSAIARNSANDHYRRLKPIERHLHGQPHGSHHTPLS
jgi:RNA polymerase sigma-70 factor (ECF subfamily)